MSRITLRLAVLFLVSIQLLGLIFGNNITTPVSEAADLAAAQIRLDGVDLQIQFPELPDSIWGIAEPGNASQIAALSTSRPFKELVIEALPFNQASGVESDLPVPQLGRAADFEKALKEFRRKQGATLTAAPQAKLFEQAMNGLTSIVDLPIGRLEKSPVLMVEWVIEAGPRLWLVRYSEEYDPQRVPFVLAAVTELRVTADNVDQTTTVRRVQPATLTSLIVPHTPDELDTPSWWSGNCNVNNHAGSSALGATYDGLVACGPGSHAWPVSFGTGVQQLEWQCAELSKRFLYLKYGIAPYSANGSQVVWNYSGTRLTKISNGTANKAPVPNDVLSYGSTSSAGHTSVVKAASVNSSGNGSITVIEQNNAADGDSVLSVSNWQVIGNAGTVSGWLHDDTTGSNCAGPSLNSPNDGYVSSSQTVNFSWSAPSGCTFSGYTFRIKDTANMESGGSTIQDTGEGDTSRAETIGTQWNNRDLYWGVRTANPASPNWSVRRFRIEPGGGGGGCEPTVDQIALFVDAGYGGQCVTKGIGDYTTPSAIGLPNDSISSVKVGSNVKVRLCQDDNYSGTCQDFQASDDNLSNNSIGSDQVSSAKVEARNSCIPNADQIALFVDANYGGQCTVKSIGEYLNPGAIGLPNDAISSVRVGSNVQAVLCRDDNYGGACDTFTGDDGNLGDNGVGDNQVSSARVEVRGGAVYPVQLYKDPNYGNGYCYVQGEGWFNLDGCAGYDNAISSVKLQSGWSLEIFSEVNMGGAHGCLTASDSDLGNNTYTNGAGVNDSISSGQVFHQSICAAYMPTLVSPSHGATFNRFVDALLSWNAANNATEYYAEFWGGPGIAINSGWTTALNWNVGAPWGGTYQWRVKSRNSGGESGWSEVRSFSVNYGSPSGLSAAPLSTSQIELSWAASADGPGNIGGYRIYRNSNSIATVGSGTLQYTDSGLACGTSHTYVVKAYNGSTESGPSNSVTASANACPTGPNAPTGLQSGTATQTSITLHWQDQASNESGFKIYKWGYTGSEWKFIYQAAVGPNITTYSESGLTCGTGYFYEVSAYNASGESAHAGWVMASTLTCPAVAYKTWLPLMTRGAGTTLLPNGDFESGRAIWTEFSTHGWQLIEQATGAHSGGWRVWLGGDYSEDAYIEQVVTVPAGRPFLTYWQWLASNEDACDYDWASVEVNGVAVSAYGVCASLNTGGWTQRTVNLTAYVGQTVVVRLRLYNDASLFTNLFIDDVGWSASSALNTSTPMTSGQEPNVSELKGVTLRP